MLIFGHLRGTYSAKSGYSWLMGRGETRIQNTSWTWIWKINAPETIKFLIWLACHNAVPTCSLLHNRGMLQSAVCQRCITEEESFLHCVRDCNISKSMWYNLGFRTQEFFQLRDVVVFLRNGLSGPKTNMFLAGLWWAWRTRNSQLFNQEKFHLQKLISHVHVLFETLQRCFLDHSIEVRQEKWIKWDPMGEASFVLNVDGSSLGNPGRAGICGLIRRANGSWVLGFLGFISVSDILHAELLAMLQGLTLAWNAGIRELLCYTDSMNSFFADKRPVASFSQICCFGAKNS